MSRVLKIEQETGFLFEDGKKVGQAYIEKCEIDTWNNIDYVMYVDFFDENYDFYLSEENKIELM